MVIDLFAEDKVLRESFLSRDFLSENKQADIKKESIEKYFIQIGSSIDNKTHRT